ncbi:MAG: toprim domain-containing protein [Bacteroidales bacterium]|nr:toprim domain-containing protein [Bacteroidales bacterium]
MAGQKEKMKPSQILNSIPILDIIAKIIGATFTRNTRDDYWFVSFIRTEEKTASLKVNAKKNIWYDFGIPAGGRNYDLLMYYLNTTDIHKIVNTVKNYFPSYFLFDQPTCIEPTKRIEPRVGTEILKIQSLQHPALLKYMNIRCIDLALAKKYCQEIWYKNNGAKYFAIGFKSESGYELRSSYFKGCTGKGITFFNNNSKTCTVTEGFFNWLSLLILYPKLEFNSNHIILNTTGNIPKAEEVLKQHDLLMLYLDRDEGGISALRKIESMGANIKDESEFYNGFNDINQYLIFNKSTNQNAK